MSLAVREGQAEAERKERVFTARKEKEYLVNKELHYQRLITENMKLKEALKLAKTDIEGWIYSKGDCPQSAKVIKTIDGLV